MLRKLMALLVGGAVLASVTAAPRERDLVRREVVDLEGVVVKDGWLRVGGVESDRSHWRFRKTPRGTLIYVSGTRESAGWSGWFLNYDHRGKDRRVGLVPEPGPGCYWSWTEGPRKMTLAGRYRGPSGLEGPVYEIPCRARPANGPLRGWSLTAGGADVVLARSPAKEFRFTASIDDRNGPK